MNTLFWTDWKNCEQRNEYGDYFIFWEKILKASVEIKLISAEACLPPGDILGLIDLNINSQGQNLLFIRHCTWIVAEDHLYKMRLIILNFQDTYREMTAGANQPEDNHSNELVVSSSLPWYCPLNCAKYSLYLNALGFWGSVLFCSSLWSYV